MAFDLKDHFIKAIQIQPNFSEAHLQLALIYQQEGGNKNAITHFQFAVSSDEKEIKILEEYANELMQNSQFQNAKKQFIKIEKKRKHCSLVYYKLALNFIETGEDKLAQDALQNSINKNPKASKAYRELALLLINNNELDAARFHLEKSIDIDYSDSKAHFLLGKIMVSMNDLNDAEQEFLSAMDINLGYVECKIEMAFLQIKMGNLKKAKDYYLEAQLIDPKIYHKKLEVL